VARGADAELVWLLGLADPVHLDDDHAFAADAGQVDEHQRASLDGAQPRRLACELPPVKEDHRFADGQFLGYLTDRHGHDVEVHGAREPVSGTDGGVEGISDCLHGSLNN